MKKRLLALILAMFMTFSYPATMLAVTGASLSEPADTVDVTENKEDNEAITDQGENDGTVNEDKEDVKDNADETEEDEEIPEPVEKKDTILSGLNLTKTIRAKDVYQDTVKITDADRRILYIQRYSKEEKKWVTEKEIQTENEGAEKLTVVYPNTWRKYNRSYWRLYLKESEHQNRFISSKVTIITRNRSELELNAKCAIIIRVDNGDILYGKNMHKRRYIASLTKIMTGILGIEKNKMTRKARISKKVSKIPYSIGMKKGDVFLIKALLHAALIASDNACAAAIAERTAGSQKKFIKLMNKKAKKLGLTETHFNSVHGLDVKNNYSTAYDVAKLMKYAMEKKKFRKIVGKKKAKFKNSKGKKFTVYTTNNLLGLKGVIGGKTGYTDNARGCFASEYTYKNKKYITVVLGSPGYAKRFTDTKKLYKYIQKYGD